MWGQSRKVNIQYALKKKNERRENVGGNNLKNIEKNVPSVEESRGSSNSKGSMNTEPNKLKEMYIRYILMKFEIAHYKEILSVSKMKKSYLQKIWIRFLSDFSPTILSDRRQKQCL